MSATDRPGDRTPDSPTIGVAGAPTEAPPARAGETAPSAPESYEASAPTVGTPAGVGSRPCAPQAAAPDIPATWGSYEVLSFVGQGGMGRVYKAFDTRLKRNVALKLLKADDPEMALRLLREAQAQARVDHPNVCKVYEVGEREGRIFMALQFIEGVSLSAAASGMALEQKLMVVRQAAEGLHAAHAEGIIHRDVKPSNIMVERGEGGAWTAFVMDFGLAREQEAKGLTETGVVMGTPNYMAPEQARGETASLDRRTDVYSLGATLYEVLTGTPPHDGKTSMEVVLSVIQEDPTPARKLNPSIPVDVETILEKCLEREPARRYASARDLAEDIGRYLEGEPVRAHRASVSYRLGKKARKHKALAIATACGLLAAAVLGTLWLRAAWRTSQQVRAAGRFGQEVKEIESILRYAHLMPLHDTRPEKRRIEVKLQRIREGMETGGAAARGPGEYALGQGNLALERYDEARAGLERAWEGGYRAPEVAQALGLALGKIYQRELEKVRGLPDQPSREAARKELEAKYRDPALRYLAEGGRAEMASAAYVKGLIDLYRRDYARGLVSARKAFEETPWLYEAKVLEGDLQMEQGNDLRFSGDPAGAMAAYERAAAAYREARAIGESDPAVHLALCSLWKWVLYLKVYDQGGEVKEAAAAMGCACGDALKADPGLPAALTEMAESYRLLAEDALNHGGDPAPACERSAEAAKRAMALDPACSEAYHHLGNAYCVRAYYETLGGRDGTALAQKAVEAQERAAALAPLDHRIALDQGNAYALMAGCLSARGADPEDALLKSTEAFRRSYRLMPSYTYAYNNLASDLNNLASWYMKNGKDGGPALREAVEALEKAVALNPKYVYAYATLASTSLLMAEGDQKRGADPLPDLAKAQESARRAIALNPDYHTSHALLAQALFLEARYRRAKGEDAGEILRQARASCSAALAINPESQEAKDLKTEIEALLKGKPPAE